MAELDVDRRLTSTSASSSASPLAEREITVEDWVTSEVLDS